MSPAMLTLVAAVLVYDLASEMWEARSSMVDTEASPRLLGALGSRRDRSWTRLENDMLSRERGAVGACVGGCRECRSRAKVGRVGVKA
jgi:hypothetical protein